MKDFKELLRKILDKLSKNQDLYNKNEVAVRDQIINPILSFYGWDTTDPDKIRPNFRTDENDIPDYSLLKHGTVQLFIEAKKITTNLKNNIQQLARYCTNQGVEYGILTNGLEWMLFKSFEKGKSINERILWVINIENDSPELIYNRLSSISFENIEKLSELTQKDEVFNKYWDKLINSPLLLKKSLSDTMISELNMEHFKFENEEIELFVEKKLSETISWNNVLFSEQIETLKPINSKDNNFETISVEMTEPYFDFGGFPAKDLKHLIPADSTKDKPFIVSFFNKENVECYKSQSRIRIKENGKQIFRNYNINRSSVIQFEINKLNGTLTIIGVL